MREYSQLDLREIPRTDVVPIVGDESHAESLGELSMLRQGENVRVRRGEAPRNNPCEPERRVNASVPRPAVDEKRDVVNEIVLELAELAKLANVVNQFP